MPTTKATIPIASTTALATNRVESLKTVVLAKSSKTTTQEKATSFARWIQLLAAVSSLGSTWLNFFSVFPAGGFTHRIGKWHEGTLTRNSIHTNSV